jgi:hypothetical protein
VPKGDSTLSRLIALALSLFAPRRWTPLSEAVEQIGSLDSLVSLLRDGSIVARHGGLYVNGRVWRPADSIDASWWYHVHAFNVAADRIVFDLDWLRATAIEVEVERAPLNALSSRRSSGGGSPPLHDWDGAKRYVDAYVAKHGPLANRTRVAELFEENFTNLREEPPTRESIYRWLRQKAQQTWVSQVVRTP